VTSERTELLLEIGVEELPASYVLTALAELERRLVEGVQELRLGVAEARSYATPRRLAVQLWGVATRQADHEEEVTGPPARAAYDGDGKPTPALLGFARGRGVDPSAVRRVQTERGEYVVATVREPGRAALEILPSLLESAITGLPFPKTMRWSASAPGFRFARPVRWVVALLGSELVPVHLAGLAADRRSYGHRFLRPHAVELLSAAEYLEALGKASVEADHALRRKSVLTQARAQARRAGGRLVEDEELVERNTFLVERSQAFLGRFDPGFLSLPREVIVTAMREHQFYFAVEDARGTLLPVFVGIRNGMRRGIEQVVHGNEFVLRARLDDARFYWETDLKRAPGDRIEELAGITWLEGFGTLRDKARRVEALAAWLAARWSPGGEAAARRAALLMKTDLLSEMIGSGKEYAALEGVIGAYYAKHHGEPAEVVAAIREHVLPRGAGDALPATPTGAVLAVADRVDSVTGYFLAGKVPSGSEDPYGVRRLGNGVLRVLLEQKRHLDLGEASCHAVGGFAGIGDQEMTRQPLAEFWRGRVETALGERGYAYDEVAAAVEAGSGWRDPFDAALRAAALHAHRRDESFRTLVVGFKRVANILRAERDAPGRAADAPGGAGWGHPAEEGLARALERARAQADPLLVRRAYPKVLDLLLEMRGAIDAFFDGVMVNDPNDAAARLRRLGLLAEVRALFARAFDLSRIVVEGTS
jgi:glycyl-tRNA synthetase beta chain